MLQPGAGFFQCYIYLRKYAKKTPVNKIYTYADPTGNSVTRQNKEMTSKHERSHSKCAGVFYLSRDSLAIEVQIVLLFATVFSFYFGSLARILPIQYYVDLGALAKSKKTLETSE